MNVNNINNAKRNLEQTNKTMDCAHILCPSNFLLPFCFKMCFVINIAVVATNNRFGLGVISYLQNFALLSQLDRDMS